MSRFHVTDTSIPYPTDESIHAAVWTQCHNLIASHPNVTYDEDLFWNVCGWLGIKSDIREAAAKLTPSSTMLEALSIIPLDMQPHFMKIYAERFESRLTV